MNEAYDHHRAGCDPDAAERLLRQQLASIEMHWRRQRAPIIEKLAHIEALKPPAPVWITGDQWAMLKPGVIGAITGKPEPAPELPGDRMHRLDFERRQLLHLLRLILAAGGTIPEFLAAQIAHTLEDIKP